MKAFILFSVLFCLHEGMLAQSQQQPDSLPQGPGWHVIYQNDTLGFASISFPTPKVGWVAGQNPNTLVFEMLHTTDSGNTWQPAESPPGGWVHFVTDSIGFINGIDTMTSLGTVFKTTDAGSTWASCHVVLAGGIINWSFATEDTFFLAGAGTVVRTPDGGKTWSSEGDLGGCNVVSFSDHLHGFCGGQVGWSPADSGRPHAANFARTTDGGTTWIPTYSNLKGQSILQLYAANAHTLIAATDHFLARSTDGGWTWDTSNRPSGYVMALSFSDTLHGIAIGFGGKVNYTIDGGRTWSKQTTATTKDFYDGQLLPNGSAYTVSDAGLILANRNIAEMNVNTQALTPLLIQVFPNPTNFEIQFTYNVPQPEHVTFRIFSTSGILISTIAQSLLQSGSQHVVLSTSALPSGDYLYQMSSEEYQASGTFTVIK